MSTTLELLVSLPARHSVDGEERRELSIDDCVALYKSRRGEGSAKSLATFLDGARLSFPSTKKVTLPNEEMEQRRLFLKKKQETREYNKMAGVK